MDTQGQREGVVLYARIWPRVKAMLIDGVVLGGAFFLSAVVGANIEGAGPVAFVVWVAFWVLYDPVMVTSTGGSIGHHVQNLRVVSDKTGGNPSFLRAFVRNVVKGVLGLLSLLAMAGSSRQKAIHDDIAGTTVQARDTGLALHRDFIRAPRPSAKKAG
jgi:uncharacterized RDD family membrane protein YckC